MSYLDWYLLAGVLVVSAVFAAHCISGKGVSTRDLRDPVDSDRDKLSNRILNYSVAPLLTAFAIIALWPLALGVTAWEFMQKRMIDRKDEQKKFAVLRDQLKERLSEEEIARRELVADPLHAAPALPFGHLNAAWEALRVSRPSGSELWSFESHWKPARGPQEFRAGYVIVYKGITGSYVLTILRQLEQSP